MSENWDYTFTWRIENYSFCFQNYGLELRSPIFTVKSIQNSTWFLSIYPGGKEKKDEEFISCFLSHDIDPSDEEISFTYKIEILTVDGFVLNTDEYLIENGMRYYQGLYKFIDREKLADRMKNQAADTLLIRCSLRNNDQSARSPAQIEARTKIIPDKCYFEWRLDLSSFIYFHLVKGKMYFFLDSVLYEVGVTIQQDDVDIHIRSIMKISASSSSSLVSGRITLLDIKGEEFLSQQDSHTFKNFSEKEVWKFQPFLTKQRIQENLSNLVIYKGVVFRCEFFVYKETETEEIMNTHFATISLVEDLFELRKDFQNLLLNHNHSDATLRVDNEELHVHRSVLAARSPVFSAIIDGEMLKNSTGIVTISDVDNVTLKSFLEFLYTGSMGDMDFEKASKLLVVAEKYQVPSLKEVCGLYLIPNLCVSNVCEVLVLADLVHHETLKMASLEFAAKHFDEIFPSPEQSHLFKENVKLFSEILTIPGKHFQVNPKKALDS